MIVIVDDDDQKEAHRHGSAGHRINSRQDTQAFLLGSYIRQDASLLFLTKSCLELAQDQTH